jgi:nucleoside-diphosphate-sugar epimerase
MNVLVAGAAGAIGSQLVPQLVARGHDVFGMTRSPERREAVRALGARPLVADVLDRDSLMRAAADAEPEIVVDQLTALSASINLRRIGRQFAVTNRLCTKGTDHLLAVAHAVRARRVIAQSCAGWPSNLPAIRHTEDAVTTIDWAEGVVLRYGTFYGPGTAISTDADASITALVRRRRFPLVGDAGGVWSFVHVEDAAAATVMAVEHAATGVYEIVDDDPAPAREWLTALALAVAAPPPRHLPRWAARLVIGEAATAWLTEARGASNRKARSELGWVPRHRSWRPSFSIQPLSKGDAHA